MVVDCIPKGLDRAGVHKVIGVFVLPWHQTRHLMKCNLICLYTGCEVNILPVLL